MCRHRHPPLKGVGLIGTPLRRDVTVELLRKTGFRQPLLIGARRTPAATLKVRILELVRRVSGLGGITPRDRVDRLILLRNVFHAGEQACVH